MISSIASQATGMQQAQLQHQVGFAVQRLAMDSAEIQAEGVQRMMGEAQQLAQGAANDPHSGTIIDTFA